MRPNLIGISGITGRRSVRELTGFRYFESQGCIEMRPSFRGRIAWQVKESAVFPRAR
jgi:hypothetical protein